MIASLLEKVRRSVRGAVRNACFWLREALRPGPCVGVVRDVLRSRSDLLAENALLRREPIVAQRHVKKPKLRRHERAVLVALSAITKGRVLEEHFFRYFDLARPHQGIAQLIPIGSSTTAAGSGNVVGVPMLNGLHHDHRRAA